MKIPGSLQQLDDRVLGDRGRRRPAGSSAPVSDDRPRRVVEDRRSADSADDQPTSPAHRPAAAVAAEVLGVVLKVARLVLFALALVVIIGIVFTLAPTNPQNTIVSHVLDIAKHVAGPFKDVFTLTSQNKTLTANYALAAAVYVLVGEVLGRIGSRIAAAGRKPRAS